MNTQIRRCTIADLDALCKIGYETFDQTFRHMNEPETMDRYLADAFNHEKILSELTNPRSHFYFLDLDDEPAGYIKVNEAPAQSDVNDPDSLEIERIYVRSAHQGKGLGAVLMSFALNLAEGMRKRYAWLGVWERNQNAIAFYQRMGFVDAGRHSFRMGDELQTDWIMRKNL